ncbi:MULTISPECIES: hypothetical protein [Sphingopyxis]|uniref:hypothetical protein n=1 Tax=Sphingopyxis TaxID=165697 RepID=UPI00082DD736|nr:MULTISPECIES: hypothetical protein [Sphingopyxis]APW72035.1 hypothetical protein BWD40_03370 [Sphingopyxis granuli]AVA12783.1 hypothetical protein C3E99_02000 [Sphingopyxis sp. MG]ODU29397.1 MAG: hypothetical protein ABS88_08720 [Sphingopyxis sp. SCN 67-31]
MNVNKLLLLYSGILTAAFAFAVVSEAGADTRPGKAAFEEIDVKRINVREDDGTIRMIVSNSSHAPGIIMHGKERPHPAGNRGAGIIFYNEEGSENGGLTFAGKTGPDGKVSGGGHLSFDQYEQDQVIQLTQSEYDGRRWAGMIINDRPDQPLDFDLAERISKMPDGPERTALLEKVQAEGSFGRQRLYVGKTRDRDSAVMLSDAMGRPRIRMQVTSDGKASIDFLDEKGALIRSVAPNTP